MLLKKPLAIISKPQNVCESITQNLKHIQKKRKKNLTTYRVYDADIPEYAFAIDMTENGVQVQEYKAPRFIPEPKVVQRRNEVLAVLPEILELAPEQIYFSIVATEKNAKK